MPHWAWAIWGGALGAIVVAFFVLEGIGMYQKKRGTLSEVVWDHFHVYPAFWFVAGGVLGSTLLWALWHFASKGKV
jgi:hypothetical protein